MTKAQVWGIIMKTSKYPFQLQKIAKLEASKDKNISNFRHWERLERKYSIRVKRLNVVIEELK